MWWTIEGTGHEPTYTSLLVHASTSTADHLYMAWALHRPRREEIWRVSRGKQVFCGYRYIWDTPHIAEQTQHGDTLFHTFYISGLEPGSEIWYYLYAPYGPYNREIQGPLMHAHLLRAAFWRQTLYFASKTKGIFKTTDFGGPGAPQPTWIPDNDGLPFLDIRQACPDPSDPYHRRFLLCHGDIYKHDTLFIEEPATATCILSNAQAVALTGGDPGTILWVAPNPNFPGHLYVLFNSNLGLNGTWALKTVDYGATWTAHQIYAALFNYDAGNLQAGDFNTLGSYPPGDVLYAALNVALGGNVAIFRSLDEGETWGPCPSHPPGITAWKPRLYVDPDNQATVYAGANIAGVDLWRTLDHGATWTLCDQGNSLGIAITTGFNNNVMGTRASDPDAIRVLNDLHIWKSSNFGQIWLDQGPTQYAVRHLHFRDDSYDFLYLARIENGHPPGGIYSWHVLFVSNDEGSNLFGKAGAHADQADGSGDSLPWNCGGAAHEGILTLP